VSLRLRDLMFWRSECRGRLLVRQSQSSLACCCRPQRPPWRMPSGPFGKQRSRCMCSQRERERESLISCVLR
jgi:hypothetical protein